MVSELLPTWAVRHALTRSLEDYGLSAPGAALVREIINDQRITGASLVFFVNAIMNSKLLDLKRIVARHLIEVRLVQYEDADPVVAVNRYTYNRLLVHGVQCNDIPKTVNMLEQDDTRRLKKLLLMVRC